MPSKVKAPDPAKAAKKPPRRAGPGKNRTEMLPVGSVSANDYNPNEMSEDDSRAYAAEVKRSGRQPRPVVVRRVGDGYTVVDGEQTLRAVKEAGPAEVWCEVIEADDFEARRVTYLSNRHGQANPVKLGRMFQKMLKDPRLSNRSLAEELGVSDGTIRNALLYPEALDLRNGYAPAEAEAQVARLTIRQARDYVNKDAGERDAWLDGVLQGNQEPEDKETARPPGVDDKGKGEGKGEAARPHGGPAASATAPEPAAGGAEDVVPQEAGEGATKGDNHAEAFGEVMDGLRAALNMLGRHKDQFESLSPDERGRASELLKKLCEAGNEYLDMIGGPVPAAEAAAAA